MAKNEDQKLPQDLKSLIDGDTSEPVKLDQKSKTKAFLFGGLASVVLVGGISLVGAMGNDNPVELQPDGPKQTNTSSPNTDKDNEWYENGPEAVDPMELPAWALKPKAIDATALTDEENEYFAKQVEKTNFGELVTVGLVSEKEGYTTNFDEALDDKGFPNPMFTSMTEELFVSQSGFILQKLLNPLYGGWGQYQFSASTPKNNFDDTSISGLFSEKFKLEHAGQPANYWPVFADWEANDYNRDDLVPSGDARWFGDVSSATVEFKYNEKLLGYEAHAVYNIQYKALNTNKEVVTKDAVLTLDLVPNPAAKVDEKQLRLLIDQASLVVK